MKINSVSASVKLYFVIVTALSLGAYKFFFNLGAFDVIFFEYTLGIWAISVAIFFGYFFVPKDLKPFSKSGFIPLVIPSVWFIFGIWDAAFPEYAMVSLTETLGLASVAFSLPYIAYLLLSINNDEAIKLRPKSLLVGIFSIFIVISFIGYNAGKYNYAFLTCEDFRVAGYSEPKNCWK